jgi:S-adenosylmethionine:tRNA ribosyltransferase-isomerase
MDTNELLYELPPERIAQRPLRRRDASRLLHLDRDRGTTSHHRFVELPSLLASGDLLVRNTTKVLPARLRGLRRRTGGSIEVLFLRPADDGVGWEVLLSPARRLKTGESLRLADSECALEIQSLSTGGRAVVVRQDRGSVYELLALEGEIPLPPYIRRPVESADSIRYQTVYASKPGSVAAPTAGLHLTGELLADLTRRGIEFRDLSLEIGLGTFQPIRSDKLEQHVMHRESYEIPPATAKSVNRALEQGRRVVPVGTTSLRALESAWGTSGLRSGCASSDLFIRPGYRFAVTGALLTNFHAPRSTLLALVMAFAGVELTRAAYQEALAEGYRFLSYGDAMLIT